MPPQELSDYPALTKLDEFVGAIVTSESGSNALATELYRSIFATAQIGEDLARELRRRGDEKTRVGHVNQAPWREPNSRR